ncbi:MAG: hypothetical protein JW833_11465 [Prolixibacteraceae bacterium]|nr:hypothetical protein [Prolixibacteraceae bacterium]
MKIKNLILLVLAVVAVACSENDRSGFAIVVDKNTFKEAKNEIDAYSESVEKQGLKTFIIVDKWFNPDSVRIALKSLYESGNNKLEGCVFIGDIPVPMIRGAQHMATAFKMDEDRYPMNRSSIPSDRFYEDFDLKFDFIQQDEKDSLLFYYRLSPESSQELSPDIYSGRIKPNNTEEKYGQIKSYLKKVVTYKENPVGVDQILFFTGHGYNSESMLTWMDEKVTLSQQFGYLASQKNLINYFNFTTDTHVKFRLLSELKRKDLDLAFLHHHGGIEAQYLNGTPETSANAEAIENIKYYLRSKLRDAKESGKDLNETKQYYHEWMGIPVEWFEGSFDKEQIIADSTFNSNLDIYPEDLVGYNSNARFIQFDACFNGSFQKDKFMSSNYIFNDGNTITVQANSVNVLQDKWPGEMNGLLGLGLRVGFWNKMSCSIETHLIGDPTLSFVSPDKNLDLNKLITSKTDDINFWKKQLESPYPDVQALALRMIYNVNKSGSSDLFLEVFEKSPYNSVRAEAFKILSFCRDKNFITAVNLGINDNYEYIQRISASYMLKSGDKSHIPFLIDALFQNTKGKRVLYQLKDAIGMFDKQDLLDELEKQIGQKEYLLDPSETRRGIEKLILNSTGSTDRYIADLSSDEATEKSLYNDIRLFRNKPAHSKLPELITFIDTVTSPKVKQAGIEMLGWFNYSTKRESISPFCDQLINNPEIPEGCRQEAIKTKNRIN